MADVIVVLPAPIGGPTVVRPAPVAAPTVVTARVHGLRGPEGPEGPAGADGADGADGSDAPAFYQHVGQGAPDLVPGAALGDRYLDVLTGDIYVLA